MSLARAQTLLTDSYSGDVSDMAYAAEGAWRELEAAGPEDDADAAHRCRAQVAFRCLELVPLMLKRAEESSPDDARKWRLVADRATTASREWFDAAEREGRVIPFPGPLH